MDPIAIPTYSDNADIILCFKDLIVRALDPQTP